MTAFHKYMKNCYNLNFIKEDDEKIYYSNKIRTKTPTHYILKSDSKGIFCAETNEEFRGLLYSYEQYKTIKPCNFESMHQELIGTITNVMTEFHQETAPMYNIVLSNEGAGKSYAAQKLIQPGMIYAAMDRKRLDEIEVTFKQLEIKYCRSYSYADNIYTCIYEFLGGDKKAQKFAQTMADTYSQECSKKTVYSEKTLKEFIAKMEGIKTSSQLEQEFKAMEKTSIYEKFLRYGASEAESGISLMMFLKGHPEIPEDCQGLIVDVCAYQMEMLFSGKVVMLMTVAKLEKLAKIDMKRRIFVFLDEFPPEVIGGAKSVDYSDEFYPIKKKIARLSDVVIDSDTESLKRQKTQILNTTGASDYIEIKSYVSCSSVIEIREPIFNQYPDQWCFCILSTENICGLLMSEEAKIYDLRHNILADNTYIIAVDGMNKRVDESKLITGDAKLIALKESAKEIFGIEDRFFVGDGIGNTINNGTFNHTNVKGRNTFLNMARESDKKVRCGISITYPNPSKISLYKAYLYNTIKNDKEFKNLFSENMTISAIMDNFEADCISTIINDNLHQAEGRLNGYRKLNEGEKTYIFINQSLLDNLHLFYFTPNVFKYSNFSTNAELRKEHADVYNFYNLYYSLLSITDETNTKNSMKKPSEHQIAAITKTLAERLVKFSIERIGHFVKRLCKAFKYFSTIMKKTSNIKKYISGTNEFAKSIVDFYNSLKDKSEICKKLSLTSFLRTLAADYNNITKSNCHSNHHLLYTLKQLVYTGNINEEVSINYNIS